MFLKERWIMELKMNDSVLACRQEIWSQTLQQTETQECVVPDTMPDIAAVLYTSGNPLIRSKDVAAGHVRLEANVPVRVTCIGEENAALFCMDLNLPVYFSAQDDAITEGSFCAARLILRQLETRVVNPRKIAVSAQLSAELRCWDEGAVEAYSPDPANAAEILTLVQEHPVIYTACTLEQTFILTDAFMLPPGSPSASDILAQRAEILVLEQKQSAGKLMLKGNVQSHLLYRTQENTLANAVFLTPFSQIIDADCPEDPISEPIIVFSGLYYEVLPDSGGREIEAEMHLVSQVALHCSGTIPLLADAYSNAYDLTLRREPLTLVKECRESVLRDTVKEFIETPAVSSVLFCDVSAADIVPESDCGSVKLCIRLCCECDSGLFGVSCCRTLRLPYDPETGCRIHVIQLCLQDIYAVPAPGGVELRVPAELHVLLSKSEELETICGISWDEEHPLDLNDQPSLVLLRAGKTPLWELAKRYHSTVEAIRTINDAISAKEDDSMLLIPKTI